MVHQLVIDINHDSSDSSLRFGDNAVRKIIQEIDEGILGQGVSIDLGCD